MTEVFPKYYTEFRCIGGECRHNCCIGWEIDIDADTVQRFAALPTAWQQRIAAHTAAEDGVTHFVIDDRLRCPFLNGEQLCEFQLAFGQEVLCDICREHPRFHNELPDRTESGLGLCCEAAARLVLGQSEPFSLQANGPLSDDDEILILRDSLLAALRERTLTVSERISRLLNLCGAAFPTATPAEWAAVLLSLERLDEAWGERLALLRDTWSTADIHGFDTHMQQRQTEYEQWLAYLIYRHVANAATLEQAAVRTLFAVLGYVVLYALGAVLWTKNGVFSFEEQCDLARAFSAEIEYSDENFYILLDALGGVY